MHPVPLYVDPDLMCQWCKGTRVRVRRGVQHYDPETGARWADPDTRETCRYCRGTGRQLPWW
jgi:hypothetical protein